MSKIKNAVTFIAFVLFIKNEERKASKKEQWDDA